MRILSILALFPFILTAQVNPVFVVKSNLSYPKFEASGDGMFGFEKDGKFGYMDRNERVIIPAEYSYENTTAKTIPLFNKGYVSLKKDGKNGLLDKTGKIIIPFEYDNVGIIGQIPTYAYIKINTNNKGLWGIVTVQNKIVIPAEYEDIFIDSNLVTVKQNGKWGLMDITGKKLLPLEYTAITAYPRDKVCRVEKDDKYGFIDINGDWLFQKPKSVYTLNGIAQGMIQCAVSGKYGFLDLKGNEVIMTKYDYASNFDPAGIAKVGKKSPNNSSISNYGFVDKKGNEVIPLKYENISATFSNGLAWAKDPETNRYGFLDKTGKWILQPAYLDLTAFDDFGGAWVKMTDAKFHYIDKTGKDYGVFNETTYKGFNKDGYASYENTDNAYVLIDKTGTVLKKIDDCDGIYAFSDGMAGYKCKSNSKYGFLDLSGNKIAPCELDGFSAFNEGITKVDKKIDGKTKSGYIDYKGNVILPVLYDVASTFRDGWGVIKKDSNYFYVDRNGNLKDPPRRYDELYEFRSSLSMGVIKGKNGNPSTHYYINKQLKEEFNVNYKEAYSFWDDVAVIKRDKEYELMNKKGEVFKSLGSVDYLMFSTDGLMAVRQNKKWGYANDKGEIVISPRYDSCDVFKYGYARVKYGTKWGIVDRSGTEIIQPTYENIFSGENGLFIFYQNGAWGVIDKTGKIIIQPTLSTVSVFEKDHMLAKMGKTYTMLRSPLAK